MEFSDPFSVLDQALNDTETKISPSSSDSSNETTDNSIGKCAHQSIYKESEHRSYCLDCGQELQSDISQDKEWKNFTKDVDNARGFTSSVKYKNIYDEIKHMNFPADIVTSADAMFKCVTAKMAAKLQRPGFNFKGLMRKSVILACIYEAYKQLAPTSISLPRLIELFAPLNKRKAFVGIKILRLKNKLIQTRYITPVDFVKDVLDKYAGTPSPSEQVEIKTIYSRIENRSESLNRSWHYSVAAGLVYYYALLKKKDICIREYSQKVKLSEFTITKIAKEISVILGTPEVI